MTTLKNVLMVNAISSGLTGLILVIAPGFVANLFATSFTQPFVSVGMFLVAFAILVFGAAFQNPLRESMISLILVLDSSWVIASLTIIVLQLLNISVLGYVFIAGVAAWVLLMVYFQFSGLRQMSLSDRK
jgi:hypothetical protein